MIKLKNILSEAEMVLRRKGGKTVTFTNKDNYEKAKNKRYVRTGRPSTAFFQFFCTYHEPKI